MIRSKATLFISTVGALLFTVPWFFASGEQAPVILGLPTWAFFALVSSVLYAVWISVCLGRYWELAAEDPKDEA